ncbi:MAG: GNAT family N-acetyltransferase [Rhizomicrobium sp.]
MAYVRRFLESTSHDGISRAIFTGDGTLIGEIHALRMAPRQFRHVLTDLTVAVHPDWQGKGLGSLLFAKLIEGAREAAPARRPASSFSPAKAMRARSGSISAWASRSKAGSKRACDCRTAQSRTTSRWL